MHWIFGIVTLLVGVAIDMDIPFYLVMSALIIAESVDDVKCHLKYIKDELERQRKYGK